VIVRFVDIGGIVDHHCLNFWGCRGHDRMVVGFTTTKCDVVKPVNGIQINLTLENRVSNVNILYEQRLQICTDLFPLKKITYYYLTRC
jgi:hypothetical protein